MPVIRVAVWDDEIAKSLHQSWSSGSSLVMEVVVLSPEKAERAVLREEVDAALLPSTHALSRIESLDILAESAISTWRNGGVLIDRPTNDPSGSVFIKSTERDPVFDLAAAIILKEHYGYSIDRESDPSRAVSAVPAAASERTATSAATLSVLSPNTEYDLVQHLDISQEWYELVNYPMVWGLFVTAKNNATDELIKGIREWMTVVYAEAVDEFLTEEGDMSDRVRPRLDDLAIASLTELCDYMFFYGATSAVPVFSPVEIQEES